MDDIHNNIGSIKPPPPIILADYCSLTDSSVSVLGGDVSLNDGIRSTPQPETPPPAPKIAPEGSIQHQWGRDCDGGRLGLRNWSCTYYSFNQKSKTGSNTCMLAVKK